jgi:ABC-type transport system involved in cytochrome c biogenesis permease subunit
LSCYGAVAVALFAAFANGRSAPPRAAGYVLAAGVLAHLAALVGYTIRHDELPLAGLGPGLSTLTFLIALLLLGGGGRRDGRPIGLVLAPLCALLLGAAVLIGVEPSQRLAFRGVWFGLHVMLAFVGYACLALAFAAGLLYLLQFRELKEKRLGRVFRYFPSLTTLDMVGRRAIVVGFPGLSLGIALGWAWTLRYQQSLAFGDPQVIWGILTWFVFFALLFMRAGGAGRERRAALANVVGFLVVVTAYLVLRVSMTPGRMFL